MRVVAVVSCLVLLVGCSPAEEPSPSPSPTAVTPSPSPTPTPSSIPSVSPSPSPSPTAVESYPADLPTGDPESAAIIAGWQEYFRVLDKFAADPFGYTDFSETQYVLTVDAANMIIEQIERMRLARLRSDGGFIFRNVDLTEVSEGSDGARTATVTYCVDAAQLRVFNLDTGERLPRAGTLQETAQMEQGRDGKWRLSGLSTNLRWDTMDK